MVLVSLICCCIIMPLASGHLAHWSLPPERAPPWFPIESSLCAPLRPVHLITAGLSADEKSHPLISNLQLIWKKVAGISESESHKHLSASIWLNQKLLIGRSPFIWRQWLDKGICVLGDLYEGGLIRSFASLRTTFDLPQCQYWKYLQLKHLLIQTFGSPSTPPPSNNTLAYILNIFGEGHEASQYYSFLLEYSNIKTASALRRTWEVDLGTSYTEGEWDRLLRNCRKMSRELRTRLIQFKILNRVYWTPSRLFKVKLRDCSTCWKCQEEEGTLMHMLWDCPLIRDYWGGIRDHIEHVLGYEIPFSPRLYILGDPSVLDDLTPYDAEWAQTALMLGRKLIMCEWRAPAAPSVNVWFTQLGQVAALERLSFRLLNRVDNYWLKWDKWEAHIGGTL